MRPPGLADALALSPRNAVLNVPPLSYLDTDGRWRVLHVLPARFQRQDYAFALPEGSSLREPINRVLPELVREADVYVEPAVR